jgi:hypothetical protein
LKRISFDLTNFGIFAWSETSYMDLIFTSYGTRFFSTWIVIVVYLSNVACTIAFVLSYTKLTSWGHAVA